MVTLLNPSDLTLNEEAHPKDKKGKQEGKFLSFYKDTPQATKDFVNMAVYSTKGVGGPVQSGRTIFRWLVLGCIHADFCK